MARPLYTLLIVFALALNGATPSMAMVSDGMVSTGPTMQWMQGGGPENSQFEPVTGDLDGSCGNFCLDCGCMSCQTRILSGSLAETMVTIDGFPSPRLLGLAPRVDADVAKPPPKS